MKGSAWPCLTRPDYHFHNATRHISSGPSSFDSGSLGNRQCEYSVQVPRRIESCRCIIVWEWGWVLCLGKFVSSDQSRLWILPHDVMSRLRMEITATLNDVCLIKRGEQGDEKYTSYFVLKISWHRQKSFQIDIGYKRSFVIVLYMVIHFSSRFDASQSFSQNALLPTEIIMKIKYAE